MAKSKQRRRKNKAVPVQNIENQDSKCIDNLLEEAETEVNSFNYERAESLCNEVLKVDCDNTKSLEMLAGIYIEQFKWKDAEELLLRCIDLTPDSGHAKYFSMGQLCSGERSLTFYSKGITILEKDLENIENVNPQQETSKLALQRLLSDAYCSVGEIFMTDCCFEENAEEKCRAAIDNAIKSDLSNPEAYQCLANLHLVKEELDEAKAAVEKSLSLWLPQHELIRDGESAEQIKETDPQFSIPVYDSRIKTSKLLIELEMFDEATKILDGLVDEDDEVVEVWYLHGWLNYLQGDEYKQNAHYYLKKAKEVSSKNEGDEDQMAHIDELLEELKTICPSDEEEADVEDCEPNFSSDSESESNKMET